MFDDMIGFLKELFSFLLVMAIAATIIVLVGWGIYEVFQLTITPQEKAKKVEEERLRATPHVYAIVDGCTVYTWYNGYNHYFTRCENKVTTESHRTENCGKACNRDVKEVIETEIKK